MSAALLTASRLKAARRCLRYHHFRYTRGFVATAVAPALRFGTLTHRWLEAYWLAPEGARREAAEAALSEAEADPFDRALARAMLVNYAARWRDADEYEVLGVEVEFRAPLVNPESGRASRAWLLAGKLDGLLRSRADGRVFVLEHKTSSEEIAPGSAYWRRLHMDGQVSVYFDGAAALGHRPAGCVYDVLRKPKAEPLRATPPDQRKYRKADGDLYAGQRATDETPGEFFERVALRLAEAPNEFFVRGEVVRIGGEMDEARHDVWILAQQVRDAERTGRLPRNPDACQMFGRPCEFWAVCSGEASLDDPTRFTRLDFPHPELSPAFPN